MGASCCIAFSYFMQFMLLSWTLVGQSSTVEGGQETSPPSNAIPELQVPSGSLGIGRIGYDWVDLKRPDRYSSDSRAHRELMVYLWYPTSDNHPDVKGAYWPGAKQMDAMPGMQPRMRREFGAKWPLIASGAISSHAVQNAPVARSSKRFPVVVFSHGNGSTCFNYTSLIEDLVSHGYVVAAVEHIGSAIAVWFPDGRVIPFHEDVMPPGLSPSEQFQRRMSSISITITEGAEDVRFVLDRLTEMNAGDSQHFALAGRLDIAHFAAMGHSAGAEFAARACQLDRRLKACVDLDGGMVPITALPVYPDGATMKQPLLFLEADHPESQMGGSHAQHVEYYKKQEEQLQSCPPGTFHVVLKSPGIAHPSFSDIPLIFAGEDGYPQTGLVLHNHALIELFVRAFLDRNLRGGSTTDALAGGAQEATITPYGH